MRLIILLTLAHRAISTSELISATIQNILADTLLPIKYGRRVSISKPQNFGYQIIQEIKNSGCWCVFDQMWEGHNGPVMDEVDNYCRELQHGYQCIKHDFENKYIDSFGVCDPSVINY